MSSELAANMVIEKTTPSRTALNFWVDLVTGIAFCILLGTSTIMKFILPPGTCDGEGVKVWLTHSRHWWGDIHFWVAVLMLALMIVHIWLHWSWVTRVWGRLIGSGRAVQTWLVLIGMAGVIAVPFIVPAQYLDVDVAPDHAAAVGATVDGATGEPVQVAPCGIEGLSCADCPAADDRLFGGGCGSDDAEADAGEAEAAGEGGSGECEDDCSTCPFSTDCDSEKSADPEPEDATDV